MEEARIIASIQAGESKYPDLYEDEAFPIDGNSTPLCVSESSFDTRIRRPVDEASGYTDPAIFNDGKMQSGVVCRGKIGAQWLMSALGCVASHPSGNLAHRLFASEDLETAWNRYGIATCRFYVDGEWREVCIDSSLLMSEDVEEDSGGIKVRPIFSRCLDENELWVPFVEKAYAKLVGGYDKLMEASKKQSEEDLFMEALVDLTGGSVHSIDLTQCRGDKINAAWAQLQAHMKANALVAVMSLDEEGDYSQDGDTGLINGSAYTILKTKEIGRLRFVQLKNTARQNPWSSGEWKGDWSNDSSKWNEHSEIEKTMMEDPELSFNREVKSGSFWMIWEDVSRHFTGMYVCNLFGEEFNQFLIQGQWKGQAAAGSHKMQRATKKDKAARPDVGTKGTHSGAEVVAALSKDYNPSGYEKPHTLVDGDARWFNNPQYRITPTEAGTQVYISLMQENHRVSKEGTKVTENLEVQAIVLKHPRKQRGRVWEFVEERLVATTDNNAKELPARLERTSAREVIVAAVDLDPTCDYVIVPFTKKRGMEMVFTMRIFSTSTMRIEQAPKPFFQNFDSSWKHNSDRDTAGGPLLSKTSKGFKRNHKFCQNPQFYVTLPRCPEDVVDKHFRTNLKIVLKRRSRQKSKTPDTIGLVVCKRPLPDLLDRQKTGRSRAAASGGGDGEGDDAMLTRKLYIADEWAVTSDYTHEDEATIYLPSLSSKLGVASDSLIVSPTLSVAGHESNFSLQFYSDKKITVRKISSQNQATLAGEWKTGTDGGCHMKDTWKRNPKFAFRLKKGSTTDGEEPPAARVSIEVTRADKEWNGKCKKDQVGCMMGFYVFQGSNLQLGQQAIYHEGKAWSSTAFVPMHRVATPKNFYLEPIDGDDDVYTIVCATFNPGVHGSFHITVKCDQPFRFSKA